MKTHNAFLVLSLLGWVLGFMLGYQQAGFTCGGCLALLGAISVLQPAMLDGDQSTAAVLSRLITLDITFWRPIQCPQ